MWGVHNFMDSLQKNPSIIPFSFLVILLHATAAVHRIITKVYDLSSNGEFFIVQYQQQKRVLLWTI